MNIFLCRKCTPTQITATSFIKEDISYQWIIFDAKMLHTASTEVDGPRIHSKFLPYPIEPCLDFTENGVIFKLCSSRLHITGTDIYPNVCICNCIITILSMETKKSIFSVKVPKQRIYFNALHSDPTMSLSFPISITLIDYVNFGTHLNDEALTIQVLATY